MGGGDDGSPWSVAHVDIAAPGVDIISTLPGGQTGSRTGNSQAAPLVTGTIGLMYASACTELIDDYRTNPAEVALGMRSKVINSADYVPSLIGLIGGGRLNVYRALYQQSDLQFDQLNLQGAETSSTEHAAIETITTQAFSSTFDLTLQAGNSIVLLPTTDLHPVENAAQLFHVDPASFACSVPYDPLNVNLIAPDGATLCGFPTLVACQAQVFGGISPYTYTWYSRLTSESDWYQHPGSNPTMLFTWPESFFVRVRVTDSQGNTNEPPPRMVVCVKRLGSVGDHLEVEMDEARVLTDHEHVEVVKTELNSGIEHPEIRVAAFPQPNTGELQHASVSIRGSQGPLYAYVLDNLGREIWRKMITVESTYEGQQVVLDMFPIASGTYHLVVESGNLRAQQPLILVR